MSNTDGPAALRRLADTLRFMYRIADVVGGNDVTEAYKLAAAWEAEREQAAADRAALEQARALIQKWRKLATGDYAMAYIAGMSKAFVLAADELEQALGGAR